MAKMTQEWQGAWLWWLSDFRAVAVAELYLLNAVPFGTPHRISGEGNLTVSSVVIVLDIWTGDGRHSSLVFFSFLFFIIFNLHNFFVCVCVPDQEGRWIQCLCAYWPQRCLTS